MHGTFHTPSVDTQCAFSVHKLSQISEWNAWRELELGIVRHVGRLLDADVGPNAVFLFYETLDFVVKSLHVNGLELGEVCAELVVEFLGLPELLLAHFGFSCHFLVVRRFSEAVDVIGLGGVVARLESLRHSGMLFCLFHALGQSGELFYVEVAGHCALRQHEKPSVVSGRVSGRVWVRG